MIQPFCRDTAQSIAKKFEAWAKDQKLGESFEGGMLHKACKHNVGMWASQFVQEHFLAPGVWCLVNLRAGGEVRCIGPYQTRSDALSEVSQGYYPIGVAEKCSDCNCRRHACRNKERTCSGGA